DLIVTGVQTCALPILVSILTVVELCGLSTFEALSLAQYSIVCRPSLEWSARAEIVTSVLSASTVWVAPPSTEYFRFLTPEESARSEERRVGKECGAWG